MKQRARIAETVLFYLLFGSILSASQLSINISGQEAVHPTGASRVFFGFIPPAYYPQDPYEFASIYVIGLQANTRVKIYDITSLPANILVDGTINRGETLNYNWTQKTKFLVYKVLGDKPVHVFQCGGAEYAHDRHEPTATEQFRISPIGCATYYPGVSGSFVDNEFLVMTAESGPRIHEGPAMYSEGSYSVEDLKSIGLPGIIRQGEPNPVFPVLEYTIYGVEDADVDVKDASDNLVTRISLSQGGARGLPLDAHKIYHIVSTGKIMFASWAGHSLTSVPATNGEFVGKEFMATVPGWFRGGFTITAYEDSEVEVYDMATGQILVVYDTKDYPDGKECRYTLSAGETIFQHDVVVDQGPWTVGGGLKAFGAPGKNVKYINLVSTGRIQLKVGDYGDRWWDPGFEQDLGDDTFMMTPIWNGKEYELYLTGPKAGTAIVFAPEDMEIKVNGQTVNLKADERYAVISGSNRIVSTKPFVSFSYWSQRTSNSWGTYLLSVTGMPATEPETREGSTGGSTLYAAIAAVFIAVAAVVALIIKRRK